MSRSQIAVRRGIVALTLLGLAAPVAAQDGEERAPTPQRRSDEGQGPFNRMVIRGVTIIDGTGAPARGPMDIVVENDRIVSVQSIGNPGLAINEDRRPEAGDFEIDGSGMYLMPGFVDMHSHTGGDQTEDNSEYVYKLWLAHGVTTSRGVNHGEFWWQLQEKANAEKNDIVAPRLFVYARPGQGWDQGPADTPEKAREWVRWAAAQEVDGAKIDGLKLTSLDPEIMEAIVDEAHQHGLGTVAHLAQTGVGRMTAIDAARAGLDMMTHYYGLFESMLKDYSIQNFPLDYNYNNEQDRFGQVARLWDQIYEPGSDEWNALLDEFLELDFGIDPTMTIYEAGRDVARFRNAEWHDKYTLPSLWDFYQPSRDAHGSYWFYWTTEDEVAWKNFYHRWMQFLNEYKNKGGIVTTGSDSGFIYKLYGFDYIREMELLREAGFHPLEVIRSATYYGSLQLHKPKGLGLADLDFGIIRPGMKADFVMVDENPLENLKVLYGTGAVRLNDETGEVERVGGVRYTIKDGIVYDAKALLADVARMVEEAKRQRAAADVTEEGSQN